MALSRLLIVEVMPRRDLDRPGPKLPIHQDRIADNGDGAARQRKPNLSADPRVVARIFRVDRNGGVPQHCLWTRGGDGQKLLGVVGQGIFNIVHRSLDLFMLDLDIGQRRLATRAPVDQSLPTVDQPLPMQPDEDVADGGREPFIQREPLALPVAGGAEPFELCHDGSTGLLPPLPDALNEFLAAERFPVGPLGHKLPLDDVLCGDAGVVRSGKPEGVISLHPFSADQNILERVVQGVS